MIWRVEMKDSRYPNMMVVDWEGTRKHARSCSEEQLRFIIHDCIEAREAMKGWNPEAEGFYQDEASMYMTELRRRMGK
jgi:hypothetical protein